MWENEWYDILLGKRSKWSFWLWHFFCYISTVYSYLRKQRMHGVCLATNVVMLQMFVHGICPWISLKPLCNWVKRSKMKCKEHFCCDCCIWGNKECMGVCLAYNVASVCPWLFVSAVLSNYSRIENKDQRWSTRNSFAVTVVFEEAKNVRGCA